MGEKVFGIYMLSTTITITLQVLNLGLGTTTFRNVAKYRGSNDIMRAADTVNTNLLISFILLLLCLLIGVVLMLLVLYAGLFNIEDDLKSYTAICVLLAAFIGGLKFCEQIFQNTFKGFEKFKLSALLNSFLRVGNLVISMVLLLSGFRLIEMLLANVIFLVANMALQYYFTRKTISVLKFRLWLNKSIAQQELSYGWWIWLQSLVIVATYQSDRYFVTYMGLDKVSYYGLGSTIFNHIHLGFIATIVWSFPKLAAMKEKGEDYKTFFYHLRGAMAAISILSICVFSLVYEPVLSFWIKAEKFGKLNMYLPQFMMFEIALASSVVPNYLMLATGHERLSFFFSLIRCVVTLSFLFAGFYIYHTPQAVLAALTIATFITLPLQNYIVNTRVTFDGNLFYETIIANAPVLLGMCLIMVPVLWVKLLLLPVLVLILWRVYFAKSFNYKLLLN